MAEQDAVFRISAELDEYKRILSKLPDITDKEARSAASRMAQRLAAAQISAAKQATKSAKQAGNAWKDAGESAKQAAEGIGGTFGAGAGGVEKLVRSFDALSKVVGPIPAALGAVGLGMVGITLAVGAGAAAIVAFINSADEAIERLDEIAGTEPLPAATIQALKEWDKAALGAEASGLRLKVLLAGELADAFQDSVPIMADAADGLADMVGIIGQAKGLADSTRPALRAMSNVISLGASEMAIYRLGLDDMGDRGRAAADELTNLAKSATSVNLALEPTLKMFEAIEKADAAKAAKALADETKAAAAAAKKQAEALAEVNSFIAEEAAFFQGLKDDEIELAGVEAKRVAEQLVAEKELRTERQKAHAERIDAANAAADAANAAAEAEAERRKLTVDGVAQLASASIGLFGEIAESQIAAQQEVADRAKGNIQNLQEQIKSTFDGQKEMRTAEEQAAAESTRAELKSKIAARRANLQDARQQAKKAGKAQKALGRLDVGVNTAAAVTKAFALFGPGPAGIAGAATAALQGATQLAVINRQQLPQFHTGDTPTAASFTSTPDETLSRKVPGESTLNKRATDAIGRDAVDELNKTGGSRMGSTTNTIILDGRVISKAVRRDVARRGPGALGLRGGPIGIQDVFGAG